MPYEPKDAKTFTPAAGTPRRQRMWAHIYNSSIARGDDEGTAIAKASGVVETDNEKWKSGWRPKNPSWRRRMKLKTAFHIGFAKQATSVGQVMDNARKLNQAVVKSGGSPANVMTRMSRSVMPNATKTAMRHTAGNRVKALLKSKKVPTVNVAELSDFRKQMISEARRMGVENGKGPIVTHAKLMKKHTARGGRLSDMQKSFESSRTFKAPALPGSIGADGSKTVVFKGPGRATKAKKPTKPTKR